MKLIVLIFFIFGVCCAVYLFLTYFFIHFKELKKINWLAFIFATLVGVALTTLIACLIYTGSKNYNSWCTTEQITNSYPPAQLVTAMDYFEKANYEYDRGNCDEALADFGKSIELNNSYPQAYNNRAYTYMKMGMYDQALTDLNSALEIDPNYLHALRNRADINTYRKNNKSAAIADFEKIIELSGPSFDVCAHLSDARKSSEKAFFPLLSTLNCINSKN